MKNIENLEDFDFGFTFADEEIEEVKEKFEIDKKSDKEEILDLRNRLDAIYESIVPFLDNLCKNPEKTTIHWPNRVEKIQMYKDKLRSIAQGD